VLQGKSILLGITGSIAAYKAIDIIKGLSQEGAKVTVIMTKASQQFITPLSIESAAGCRVYSDMFEDAFSHIDLPRNADLFLIAPATANIISKHAMGVADDLLSTAILTFRGDFIIAPAMNWRMYENPVIQKNLEYLKSFGVKTIGPEWGSLACGEEGIGRMSEPKKIIESVRSAFTPKDMHGEKVLVTAGPTREYIDPVRFISNRSSGKMGYAIATAAARRGAIVTMISGQVSLEQPEGITVLPVNTAAEMHRTVMDKISASSILIMCAAVSDYTPAAVSDKKIEKTDRLTLELVRTKDILYEVGLLSNKPFIVGFSAETGYRIDRAQEKLLRKNVDIIVFNDVSKEGSGFDVDTNEVVIIDKYGQQPLPLMHKEAVAMKILDRIMELKKKD
jgi:phosphopantothenoylcysteine decarboxylase/phosphopantothenate--cysteine ligase